MPPPLSHWCNLYQRHKHEALCIDIETTGWNKPISVIGLYRPSPGIPEVTQLIRDQGLTREKFFSEFGKPRLLITFNGIAFDLKRIRAEFPNTIPYDIPVLDLYRMARRLGLNTDLKTLENTYAIDRPDNQKKGRIAVKLWQQYRYLNDTNALRQLLEYNRQDTINLYPLAEELVENAIRQSNNKHLEASWTAKQQIFDRIWR